MIIWGSGGLYCYVFKIVLLLFMMNMREKFNTFNQESKEKEPKIKRVILSDTQGMNLDKFKTLSKEFLKISSDKKILLGDIFSSHIFEEVGEKIKSGEITKDKLSTQQLKIYHKLKEEGYPEIRCITRSIFESDDNLVNQDIAEIDKKFRAFTEQMHNDQKVDFIMGNVEVSYPWRKSYFTNEAKKINNLTIYDKPGYDILEKEKDKELSIYVPSLDVSYIQTDDHKDHFKKFTKETLSETKRQDITSIKIYSHEYLFKGPQPEVYKKILKEKGFDSETNITPWYMPSNIRLDMLAFLRSLHESGINIEFIYGHIEDSPRITREMLPFLNMSESGIIDQFRLYGFSSKNNNKKSTPRATIKMRQIEKNKIHEV